MDSIPGARAHDDEQAAASAIRELLQNDEMAYDAVESVDGVRTVRRIRREGPSVLITTTPRVASSGQFSTRLAVLTLTTDPAQIDAALEAQADLELHDVAPTPDLTAVAFQTYLQALAPFDVVIPFLRPLQQLARKQRLADPRILRDMSRLCTLIKAAATLHHRRRQTTPTGRIVATLADYATVLGLYNEVYEATSTGVTAKQRELVEYIEKNPNKSLTILAAAFRIAKPSMWKRLKAAKDARWIVNAEWQRGEAQQLVIETPCREKCGLPSEVARSGGMSTIPPTARRTRWTGAAVPWSRP